MKFDKNKHKDQEPAQEDKDTIRKKIWETPTIIGKLFTNQAWEQFDTNAQKMEIPSANMLEHIHTELSKEELQKAQKQLRKLRTLKIIRYSGAAAAAILLVCSLTLWQKSIPSLSSDMAEVQQKVTSPLQDTLWKTIENTTDRIKTVRLPDHSTVGIFAHSTIRYPENFSEVSREIHLDGKAYFSVAKDPSRPFSVYAGGTKTTALGTSFTINTRSGLYKTSVKLHTGKIVIASTQMVPLFHKTYLSAKGESFIFDSGSNRVELVKLAKKQVEKAPKALGIKLSDMDNIPLTDVFVALQEAYKVKINIGSATLANIQYTGSIDVETETIHDALTLICLINDLRYVIQKDGSYTIYSTAPINKK